MSDGPHPNRMPDYSAGETSKIDDPRLFKAVQEYLTAIEQGVRVNRRDFVMNYPDIAVELANCLDALAFVNSAAGEMSEANKSQSRKRFARSGKSDIDLETAQPLGDFKLIRELGHGGMGTVYEAMQLSLGRRVAVKVLPLAAALDERHLERFHNEAQAAARLHHTNIVPVFAVGCERSVHFYAMQLIEGHSLADVIRDLRALSERPAAVAVATACSLDTEETLTTLRAARSAAYYRSVTRLALQVAEALAYAHEAGVVHRDIKPANLLLDAHGKLWVTDFGLAQLNVETGLTRSGDLIGTLRYMSPEQASGRAVVLDQRTDIYSLGVTFYELLTLQRALPGTTHEQLLHQIVHHPPRSLRSIDKTIPRELETIIQKAISKDALDRYASADAFAGDLRRFLKDEPILARPPSLLDRGLKWTRRHKGVAAGAFAALALIALGLSLSTVLIARAQARTEIEYQKERENAIAANVQRVRAERSGRLARQAVEFFSRIASEEMDTPGFSDIRREMLEESLSYYQSFLEEGGDTPSVSAELTSARTQVNSFLKRYTALDTLLRTSARVRLLNDPSVRGELGVTPMQVRPLLDLASAAPASNKDAPAAAQEKSFTDQVDRLELAVRNTLVDREQRLVQIYRQTIGPIAMSDPDVIERLALTRTQQASIRALLIRFRSARAQPFGRDGPPAQDGGWRDGPIRPDHRGPAHDEGPNDEGPPDDAPPDHQNGPDHPFPRGRAVRAQTMGEILALLTPAQRSTWNELLGKPFAIESIRLQPPEGREPDRRPDRQPDRAPGPGPDLLDGGPPRNDF